MTRKQGATITEIHTLEEVPEFASEAEEAAFWDTHSFSDELWDSLPSAEDELPPPRSRTKPIAVRFDPETISRLKAVARKKGKGYQTLLKEFVVERLYEEEKREGMIPEGGPAAKVR
jgi:predicted DNA binding CopG/RHH family protein